MKIFSILAALLLAYTSSTAVAYEISGAKPIDKLVAEQAKAKSAKKLMCVVFQGADTSCPHCAAAADNGTKAIRASTEMVVITEAQVKDPAVMASLPKAVRELMEKQTRNAYVSFNVFDQELTTLIASADREMLENDKKKTREFAEKVRDARKALR